MKIRILDAAVQDLVEGFRFYENLARGLGAYFTDSLFSDIDSLSLYGEIHPIFFDSYHRMLSKRFPFAVYYRIVDQEVLLYAVLDCRRSPAWTRGRLGTE